MAFALYRLGRAAARFKGWFIAAWLVILLAVGGLTAAFQGPFSNDFKLPSAPSYQTLERLKSEFPEASRGQGVIALMTKDKATEAQKKAVADVAAELEKKDYIADVRDPFSSQAQLDEGQKKIDDFPAAEKKAKAQFKAGQTKIDAGRAQLKEQQAKIDAGQKQIDSGRAELKAGQAKLAPIQKQIAALRAAGQEAQAAGIEAQIAPQVQQAQAASAQLDASQKELDAGQTQLTAASKELDAAQKKIDDGRAKLKDGKSKVASAQKQLDSAKGLRFVSEDGTTSALNLSFNGSVQGLTDEQRTQIKDITGKLKDKGFDVEYSTEVYGQVPQMGGVGEVTGVIIAAILLFLMLGTLVAAGLPLLSALMGVGVGLLGALSLSSIFEFSSVSLTLGLMLGLAVGIDYSLFIVNRYRTQRLAGDEKTEAIGIAVGTAGNAVAFAGMTVIIALAALVIPGIPFLGVMGLVGAGTVFVSVLVALTLTPALISAIGRQALPKKLREVAERNEQLRASGQPAQKHEGKERAWGRLATRRPWLSVAAAAILLGLLAIPSSQLKLALPDGGAEAKGSTQYKTYYALADAFGAGINGPLVVVSDFPAGTTKAQAEEIQYKVADSLRGMDGVQAAVPALVSENHRTGMIQVVPKGGPSSDSTKTLVGAIQDAQGSIKDSTGAVTNVTGNTAVQIDVSKTLAKAMPLYLSVVVGLSLILLLLVFRSIWVPLLATGGFLLSLFATFGAVVLVFQKGILAGLFQVSTPGPVVSFLPMIVVGVLFGLAMDYQMFLVSAMREAYVHGTPARDAVRKGFNSSARVVTVAALIMVAVFSGFIFSKEASIKPMGFALAFGVLVDAFIIRMTLTPALLHLLGERAWKIPAWLDRALPRVDVEGEKLTEKHDGAEKHDSAGKHGAVAPVPAEESPAVPAEESASAGSTAAQASAAPAPGDAVVREAPEQKAAEQTSSAPRPKRAKN